MPGYGLVNPSVEAALEVAAVALLGAVVGSFLNAVIYRLPRGQSLLSRSRCPACRAPIAVYDNVPILSWLLLRGRCRSCGEGIPARYLLVELLTAAAFGSVALARGVDAELILFLPFVAALIAVAAIDLEHRIVPNRIVVPAALFGIAASAVLRPGELPELAIAGTAAFGALLVAALAYPAGMGMGDVKLAGAMGLYLGVSIAPAMLGAFLAGTLVGLVKIARDGPSARKAGVAFAPFLALGGLLAVLAGPELVDLYRERLLS